MKLNDLSSNPVRIGLANMAFQTGLLAVATTTTAVKTVTNTVPYTIDGIFYTKAPTDNMAITSVPTGYPAMYVQPANTTVYYVLALDSSGNLKCIQGNYSGRTWNDTVTGLPRVGDGSVPDCPDTLCPIGVLKVASGGSTFTVGTTALTGISTFYNVAHLPATAP